MKSERKEVKIVLIRDTQVGKTNILKRATRKKSQITMFPQLEKLMKHIIFKLIMSLSRFKYGTLQAKINIIT
jgi:GTPase SAR1 family protein